LTDTNEQLLVNKQFAQGFYIDDMDDIQNMYSAGIEY
jgi:hypothetical protein